jgi:hypothetical protein
MFFKLSNMINTHRGLIRMNRLPSSIQRVLRRLAWRLAVGQFMEIWPRWAVGSLLIAGTVALICRMFYAPAASTLVWLWLSPIVVILPVAWLCVTHRYRQGEVVAIADWLSGGQGTLLTLVETQDTTWSNTSALNSVVNLSLPRIRPFRQLWPLLPAAVFLAVALLMPQRISGTAGTTVLADDIVRNLKSTLAELKKENVIAPDEEKKLEEEIERIRAAAMQRVDSSSWEASDAVRDQMAAYASEKRDALKWAQESIARYAAAQAGGSNVETPAEELAKAIEKLAQAGLLADAPSELQNLLGGRYAVAGGKIQLPTDAASLRKLSELLSTHLQKRSDNLKELTKGHRELGQFDPTEYPEFSNERGPAGDGDPGNGGIDRGRGDAPLTWGKESANFDHFKAVALLPGAVRSPDDWSPVAVLPGAPKASPQSGGAAAAQQYRSTAGQAAWRHSLAPRHQSAVKKYFGQRDNP